MDLQTLVKVTCKDNTPILKEKNVSVFPTSIFKVWEMKCLPILGIHLCCLSIV